MMSKQQASFTASLYGATEAHTKYGPLTIAASIMQRVDIDCPPHVAETTAAAFNRAMQAVKTDTGYTYTTKYQTWHIRDEGPRIGWQAQSEEVTGDNDPHWLFADGKSLFSCMDDIDAQETENCCDRCTRIPGLDNLHELGCGKDMELLCQDCFDEWAKDEEAMIIAAGDEKAHAYAEGAR